LSNNRTLNDTSFFLSVFSVLPLDSTANATAAEAADESNTRAGVT